jgi:hypothetical protein
VWGVKDAWLRNPKAEPQAKVKGRKIVAEELNQGIHSCLFLELIRDFNQSVSILVHLVLFRGCFFHACG